jgi:hypothetical protein
MVLGHSRWLPGGLTLAQKQENWHAAPCAGHRAAKRGRTESDIGTEVVSGMLPLLVIHSLLFHLPYLPTPPHRPHRSKDVESLVLLGLTSFLQHNTPTTSNHRDRQ